MVLLIAVAVYGPCATGCSASSAGSWSAAAVTATRSSPRWPPGWRPRAGSKINSGDDLGRRGRVQDELRRGARSSPPDGGTRSATYGERPGVVQELPLTYSGEPVGRLTLPARGIRSLLSRRDQALLVDLVRQSAIAIRSATLATELQASREQLVHDREDDRRRIRRDLHDGLGPALGGVALRLDAAGNALDRSRTQPAADQPGPDRDRRCAGRRPAAGPRTPAAGPGRSRSAGGRRATGRPDANGRLAVERRHRALPRLAPPSRSRRSGSSPRR